MLIFAYGKDDIGTNLKFGFRAGSAERFWYKLQKLKKSEVSAKLIYCNIL